MCALKITFGLAVWMSKFCNTLPKPDLFYTGVPSILESLLYQTWPSVPQLPFPI